MRREEWKLGTVTEKHTIVDLRTGRRRHALVVRPDDDAACEDWFFVSSYMWKCVTIEGVGGNDRVKYAPGRGAQLTLEA